MQGNKRTNERTNERANERTNSQTNERTNERFEFRSVAVAVALLLCVAFAFVCDWDWCPQAYWLEVCMRSMPASRELDVGEMSSASSVRYDYMSRAELRACCGKKHGNSITANKKDNEGRWKTKSKNN